MVALGQQEIKKKGDKKMKVKDVEKKMTQAEFVLDYIQKHGKMTSMEAFDFGITRLSARIYELRKMGYKIRKNDVTQKTKNFGSTTYAEYYLEKEDAAD